MKPFRGDRPVPAVNVNRRSPGAGPRAAHTLLEILLALALSLVILTAVYAALDQHWRYAEAGQQQTERMQVTRALFERLSLDVRSVVFRPAADPVRNGGAGGSGNAGGLRQMNVIQPDEPYVGRSVGIMGDAETLLMRVSAPEDDRSRGLRTVCWAIRASDSSRPESIRAAGRREPAGAVTEQAATEQAAFGLVRLARDNVSPTALAGMKSGSSSDLVAAEVEFIRFRYFARGSWFDRWDSVAQGELPQAVEITIGFRRAPPGNQESGGPTSPGDYRLVVPVPAAEA